MLDTQKAIEWIQRKTTGNTRQEYLDLLTTNERMCLELIQARMRIEELIKVNTELQDEIYAAIPTPTFTFSAEAHQDVRLMEQRYRGTWRIDPYRVNFALADTARCMMGRYGASEVVRDAFKQAFDRRFREEVAQKIDIEMYRLIGDMN